MATVKLPNTNIIPYHCVEGIYQPYTDYPQTYENGFLSCVLFGRIIVFDVLV